MGLQTYFGALGAADRARHYNLAAYVLLQQSRLYECQQWDGLNVRTTLAGRRGRVTCRGASGQAEQRGRG